MAKVIRRSQILRFLDWLEKNYLVIAPIKKEGNFVFELINPSYSKPSRLTHLVLDYPTTILPPTKIALLPPKQKMVDFSQNQESRIRNQELKPPTQVLFGVHDYDIQAINLLDKIMSKPKKDQLYLEGRKKTIIIGVDHKQAPQHFDHLFEFDIEGGYDLFLTKIKNFYIVSVGSKIGEKLAKLPFFEDSTWEIKRTKEKDKDIIFSSKTSKLIEKSKDSKIWNEVATRCFGCGICSYVCPLCYCFETFDEISLYNNQKCRYKRWDACFLPEFFEISGGINLKEKLRDRIYNWYYHKFVRIPEEYGHPGCVGCGRCIAQCPAKINFRNVLKDLIKESHKNAK